MGDRHIEKWIEDNYGDLAIDFIYSRTEEFEKFCLHKWMVRSDKFLDDDDKELEE